MTREARLDLIDQRKTGLDEDPAPRIRVRIAPLAPSADPDRSTEATQFVEDDDNLRAARGILAVTLLSIGFWMAIGLVIWLIAR